MPERTENVEVVEIYVPARLRYLSELYNWLDNELHIRRSQALYEGFSLYEVRGAFRGRRRVYQEPTMVVRLIFRTPRSSDTGSRELASYEARIREIGEAVVQLTHGQEEEIWILRTSASKYVRLGGGL